jgi:hypothetical protein
MADHWRFAESQGTEVQRSSSVKSTEGDEVTGGQVSSLRTGKLCNLGELVRPGELA